MITIKKYFLYGIILNSFYLVAMDSTIDFEKIRDKIDYDHLAVSKNTCFRPIIGSFKSYYKTTFLPKEKVTDEMEKIQSYIPSNDDRKFIFKELVHRHWYVNYLMQALLEKKIKKFDKVKGTTIDKLCFPDFTSDAYGMEEMLYKDTYQIYFTRRLGIKNQQKRILYLCDKAFWRNPYDRDELIALRNSESFKTIIGYQKDNLLLCIQTQLDQLT